ncbi:hypothetical protein Plhal304r1_c042g0121101 [Plasmopara halstedii]
MEYGLCSTVPATEARAQSLDHWASRYRPPATSQLDKRTALRAHLLFPKEI